MKKDNKDRDIDFTWDDNFSDGVFAVPRKKGEPRIKLRALFAYCEKHNTKPEFLTKEEMEQFLVR